MLAMRVALVPFVLAVLGAQEGELACGVAPDTTLVRTWATTLESVERAGDGGVRHVRFAPSRKKGAIPRRWRGGFPCERRASVVRASNRAPRSCA
jgi:hypothetical protein